MGMGMSVMGRGGRMSRGEGRGGEGCVMDRYGNANGKG